MALIFDSRWRAIDSSGAPYSGALLYVYLHGTTTLADLFTESTLTTPLANPVEADSGGRFPQIHVAIGPLYDLVQKTSGGVTITTYESLSGVQADSGDLTRTFSGARLRASSGDIGDGDTGLVIEAGDPSPDNTGGKMRLGGYNGTLLDKMRIGATATAVEGTLDILGATTLHSTLTLADGSTVNPGGTAIKRTGAYYPPDTSLTFTTSGTAITANQIYWVPFGRSLAVDAIMVRIQSTVAGNCRIGLYTSNPTTGLPDSQIFGSSAISTSIGDKVAVMTSTYTISSRVWLAFVADAAAFLNNSIQDDHRHLGDGASSLYSTFAYAALPVTAPAITGASSRGLSLFVRAA